MKKESKDLTEQAVKKELRGYYYAGVHQYEGECDEDRFIDIVCCDQYGVSYESCYDGWDYIIKEVPDYEDVRYMESQIERLQEQLKKLKQENTIHNNKAKKRRIHINNLKNENKQLREQLKEKNIKLNELRHQRNEANEVIKNTKQITGNIDLSQFDYEHRRKIDGITMETDSYLDKWGVK